MVKLTVLYNLPPGADHEEFIRWRTTDHQRDNAGMPGVIRTDFYVAEETPMGPPKYRYITESYWEDMESLHRSFFAPEAQAKLAVDVRRITDAVFLISREAAATAHTGPASS